MPDREKVIKGLEICSDCGFCESIKKFDLRCPYRNNDGKGCDRSQLLMDALALLKEQEHKDKMHHALAEDWKRIQELMKEDEGIVPYIDIDEAKCPTCKVKLTRQELLGDDVLYEDFFDYCPRCGRKVKWK